MGRGAFRLHSVVWRAGTGMRSSVRRVGRTAVEQAVRGSLSDFVGHACSVTIRNDCAIRAVIVQEVGF